jgi:hypothetical protein
MGEAAAMAIESDRAEFCPACAAARHGRAGGAAGAQQGLGELAEHDARRAAGAGRIDRRQSRAGGAASPGHADLAGASNTITTTSATCSSAPARGNGGARARRSVARQLLRAWLRDHEPHHRHRQRRRSTGTPCPFDAAQRSRRKRRCAASDTALEKQMMAAIDAAKEAGDTLGGSFEVIARKVPVGLGSYVQWDRKLDGRLAQALMSIRQSRRSRSATAWMAPDGPVRRCMTRSCRCHARGR